MSLYPLNRHKTALPTEHWGMCQRVALQYLSYLQGKAMILELCQKR